MRALITGGAGFIGSHLTEELLARGQEVHVLDDLSTGSVENLDLFRGKPGFAYTVGSVMDVPLLAELVDRADVVYHLAAAVGVKLIVLSPVQTIETNVKGTENVLALAAKKRRRVLIASTSEVYGKAARTPFSEDDDLVLGPPTKGRWAYACSKAIDEFLALAYWKEKRLPVTIVRFFNTVGPRQTGRYGMVIPTFVRQALTGRPITVYGDGSQRRCFGYVKDAARAAAELVARPEAVGQAFNIGSDQEISIVDLAARVKSLTGSPSDISFVPYEKAYEEGFEDMPRRVPETSKIRAMTGYAPSLDLDGIIRAVIEHERAKGEARLRMELDQAL